MEGPDGNKPAAQTLQLEPNIQVLKEPRGLMRVLQFIFSIFAFSTTAGFWTDVKFAVTPCCSAVQSRVFSYPFSMSNMDGNLCNACKIDFVGGSASQAQFFVATGVLSFIFSIVIVAFYLLLDGIYQNNPLAPVADFVVTAVLSVFWLAASSAWAQGVSDLKYFSNPQVFLQSVDKCLQPDRDLSDECYTTYGGSFATVNVSLIFGFLNFALWGASLWFVFKETYWFKQRQSTPLP